MAKRYTAEEIRAAVQKSICEDNIAEMLLQYADELERERKYEYAECYFTSSISTLHESSEDDVRLYASNGSTVVRRTVGEWEQLPRRCGE